MLIKPSIVKVWQRDEPQVQPNCYQPRNPATPWCVADSELHDQAEDIDFARDWIASGARAGAE